MEFKFEIIRMCFFLQFDKCAKKYIINKWVKRINQIHLANVNYNENAFCHLCRRLKQIRFKYNRKALNNLKKNVLKITWNFKFIYMHVTWMWKKISCLYCCKCYGILKRDAKTETLILKCDATEACKKWKFCSYLFLTCFSVNFNKSFRLNFSNEFKLYLNTKVSVSKYKCCESYLNIRLLLKISLQIWDFSNDFYWMIYNS